jgi:competence/damage-inducible protein CinA-like protein
MPTLEIITIGTELLLGEIADTNSTHIARTLRDHGIDIYRITTIGDNPHRIAATIKEALQRADIIITTGGLGPTVDDPTRQAVAAGTDRDLVFSSELWDKILNRFKTYGRTPTDNNRRQAFIPEGAIPIENPVGTAPCYIVEIGDCCVISLPGVPREMDFILHRSIIPYLVEKYALKTQTIRATVLHAASLGESRIDELIADLEEKANPTVGLLAHPGQVDIRVTAKAESEAEALRISKPIIADIRSRLGDNIYGQDEETLVSIICRQLATGQTRLTLIEYGSFLSPLKLCTSPNIQFQTLSKPPASLVEFENTIKNSLKDNPKEIHCGATLEINDHATMHLVFAGSYHTASCTRYYGGPHDDAPRWAQNTCLDFIRRQLIINIGREQKGEL